MASLRHMAVNSLLPLRSPVQNIQNSDHICVFVLLFKSLHVFFFKQQKRKFLKWQGKKKVRSVCLFLTQLQPWIGPECQPSISAQRPNHWLQGSRRGPSEGEQNEFQRRFCSDSSPSGVPSSICWLPGPTRLLRYC